MRLLNQSAGSSPGIKMLCAFWVPCTDLQSNSSSSAIIPPRASFATALSGLPLLLDLATTGGAALTLGGDLLALRLPSGRPLCLGSSPGSSACLAGPSATARQRGSRRRCQRQDGGLARSEAATQPEASALWMAQPRGLGTRGSTSHLWADPAAACRGNRCAAPIVAPGRQGCLAPEQSGSGLLACLHRLA